MPTPNPPTDAELQAALTTLYSEEQLHTVGVEEIVASLKALNTSWNDVHAINTKRVQTLLQEKSAQNNGGSEVKSTGGSSRVSNTKSKAGVHDVIDILKAKILHLQNQRSRGSCKDNQLQSLPYLEVTVGHWNQLVQLVQSSGLEKIMTEAEAKKDEVEAVQLTLLPYKLFFTEWDAFLGPDPLEPMAPAGMFDNRLECIQFPALFPLGTDNYLGPGNHPDSFNKYVMEKLRYSRFQQHALWLQWALTLIEDREVAAVINMCMVATTNTKARHIGEGVLEVLPIEENFATRKLNSQGTKLVEV